MLKYRQKNFFSPSKIAVEIKKGKNRKRQVIAKLHANAKSSIDNYKVCMSNQSVKSIRMPNQYVEMSMADYCADVQKSYTIEKGYLFSTMLYFHVCRERSTGKIIAKLKA